MRLYRQHLITRASYRSYAASFNSALATVRRLRGARAAELEAVIENLHSIAAAGLLSPSRLPALFLTLDSNRRWWQSGPLLSYGERVEFAGSDIVWEYYPGQGIELQVLGSFGKAQWFCAAGVRYAAKCRRMVAELVPLAANRAGGLVWEYYFRFDGGVPPWTSAMSQGTALQTLADAYRTLGDPSYLEVGRKALRVFSVAPPLGVGVRTRLGMRFVQYSFASARNQEVLNGFLQSLIGLSDYAQASGDSTAARLFEAGDSEAQAEVPQFDTGAWSLYQLGEEDSLDYHVLVTGFLQQLCRTTEAPVYCTTASNFNRYLKTPAVLEVLTGRLRAHRMVALRFHVSKISRVGVTLVRNGRTVWQTSANFTYGSHAFALPVLTTTGRYTVTLDATDLAGNYSSTSRPLRVTR
ncbi:MAG TPA: D-glucuronyl C5-epimerase family protein [Solirubrobacteraceae bacterium]|nr:D-glucuronyl C5-epimerase family protein [Solirubrobacteraceae bacterium]